MTRSFVELKTGVGTDRLLLPIDEIHSASLAYTSAGVIFRLNHGVSHLVEQVTDKEAAEYNYKNLLNILKVINEA